MSEPASVYLPTKDELILKFTTFLELLILIEMMAFADAQTGSRPVVLVRPLSSIFVVKIRLYAKVSPHLKEVEGVLRVCAQRSKLVLYLYQNYVSSIYLEVRRNHLGQGLKVDEHFILVGLVRGSNS